MNLIGKTILFLVTQDWYFYSHRLPVARAARDAGAKVIVATQINHHQEQITAEGFELYPIDFDRCGLNPLHDIKTIGQIIKCYKHIKPDLVHHVAMKPVLYGSIAAVWASVPATINAMAGLGIMFTSNRHVAKLFRPLIKLAFHILNNRQSSIIILQNPDDAEIFKNEIGVQSDRIKVIRGSGVNIKKYDVTAEPPGKIIATCVSRMLWDKGIGELIKAARLLKKRGVKLTIRLVGPTDDNPASIPQAILDDWAHEGIVEILVPSSDIAQIYSKSHIAILASYREGLPKSLLEAAACGRPMIAADVPGCREICRDGETGILIPSKSVSALADALQKLTEDKALRLQFGMNARKAAETDFAENIIAKQTMTLYQDILKL